MKVKLKLFASLRKDRFKEKVIAVNKGTTPFDLLQQFGIEREEAAILLINGRDGELDRELQDGDVVSVFPPLGGG